MTDTIQPATSLDRSRTVAMKQQAYRELKQLILTEDLPAGTVQSVRQLAARLGMSKTPVHAAVERLEAEGLMTLAPQQGVVVCEMSLRDVVNHFEIRLALEPFVMRRLAGTLSQDQVQLLRENLSCYRDLASGGTSIELVRTDSEFHQLLCRFLANEEIVRVMQQLRDKVQRVIFRVGQRSPACLADVHAEHQAILDALVDGDGDRAGQAMYDHLDRGLERFWPRRTGR